MHLEMSADWSILFRPKCITNSTNTLIMCDIPVFLFWFAGALAPLCTTLAFSSESERLLQLLCRHLRFDWLTDYWLTDWLTIDWLTDYWLTDYWLTDWLTDYWLTDWLTIDWLTDWLPGGLIRFDTERPYTITSHQVDNSSEKKIPKMIRWNRFNHKPTKIVYTEKKNQTNIIAIWS